MILGVGRKHDGDFDNSQSICFNCMLLIKGIMAASLLWEPSGGLFVIVKEKRLWNKAMLGT